MDYVQGIIADYLNLGKESAWMVHVFAVVFATLLVSFFCNRFLKRLIVKLQHTKTVWDDAFVIALRRPLRTFIWVHGLVLAAQLVKGKVTSDIMLSEIIDPLQDILVISIFAWFAINFISEAERNILQKGKTKLDQTTADAISKLLKAAVIITAGLIILQTLGFSVTGVLAFGGMGGVAIGFAAKDLLANFFGALMIYFDRPFAVGDWIRSPDKNLEGTVEKIGWRQTRIRTFDKRPLYVPNSVFSTIIVENPSRMLNRRVYEYIGVRYNDMEQADTITSDVKKMLVAHKEIDENQTLMVNVDRFGPSSVDFFVYAFTYTKDWVQFHNIKQEILLHIAAIIENHGAEIAYPTQTLHMPEPVFIEAPRQPKTKKKA